MKKTEVKLNVSANTAADLRKIKQYAELRLAVEYGEEVKPVVSAETGQAEGIYLIYADGHSEPYTGSNDKKDVAYIGVSFAGHRFALALTEKEAQLLQDDTKATTRESYKKRECDALYDYDSFGNTEKLVADNGTLADLLNPGEAIPALGVLVIVCHLKKQINDALAYVGGEQLTDNWYWSSTESSENSAWGVNFSRGYVYNLNKYNGIAVRAVAAF